MGLKSWSDRFGQVVRYRRLYPRHYARACCAFVPSLVKGERRIYDALGRQYYWPHIAKGAYATVADCQSCTEQDKTVHNQKQLRHSPDTERLEVLVMDNRYSWSIIKDKIRQSLRNCLERPIYEAEEGHPGQDSIIDECCNRVPRQLGHLVWCINLPTDQQRTAALLEHLCSRDRTIWN